MSKLKEVLDSQLEKSFETYQCGENQVHGYFQMRFTTKCPVLGHIDYLLLTIEFVPNAEGVFIEYDSFYRWVRSFADKDYGIEKSCSIVFENIMKLCSPIRLKVVVETSYLIAKQRAERTTDLLYQDKM